MTDLFYSNNIIISTRQALTPSAVNDIYSSSLEIRNNAWANSKYIPTWVNVENVGLDQFFTRPAIAKECFESLCAYIKKANEDLSHYKFVEPSAGLGAFYDLLPESCRIGIDIFQYRPDFILTDFLSWMPEKNGRSYAVIGNPPFGYRAWLALAFVNHAALFADYVGFIVPMAFQSRGKGNVQDRVKGLKLVYTSSLPSDSFVDIDGKSVKVNALWQIWARDDDLASPVPKTCNKYIDLFTVDMRKERLCGQKRLSEADYFIQRTFYNEPPTLVTSFDKVRYVCGYGIVIKRNKREITELLKNADWRKYNNLASHNCRHISMCHIRKVLTDAGFVDD
ncbi:MAG: hypothetical protein L7F77_14755 [Candidatus Magnetominusculus sp. LBB02]|nr:hypothetical protein [Candidatus Magnetominusculus sp. LBB02]